MSEIHDALEALSKASGVKALIDAHQKAGRAISGARSRIRAQYGALAQVFREAMRLIDRMKADGATKQEREEYVANVLKASWPKGREEPWHYDCRLCDDSGWQFKTCQQGSCGRPFKLPGQSGDDWTGRGRCADGHSYMVPCYCAKGQGFKRQLTKAPRPIEDAVAMAAKSKPTKLGR